MILAKTRELLEKALGEDLRELKVERSVIGLFFSGVKLSNGEGGICFTPVKEIPEAVCCPSSAKAMPLSGKLTSRSVKEYLEDIEHPNILRRMLSIAVLNALSATYWKKYTPEGYSMEKGVDSFDQLTLPQGKTVVVGALVPILRRLIKEEKDFTVLEMDPRTLKGKELDHYAPASEAGLHIPKAELLVITGTTLINNTLEELLDVASPKAEILITGPSVSMIPHAFFEEKVTQIGGMEVIDPDKLLDLLAEGGSGYHFFGKSAEKYHLRKL